MNIVAATQQFAVHGHTVLHSGRLERPSNHPSSLQSAAALPQNSAAQQRSATTIVPEPRQALTKSALSEPTDLVAISTESTLSAAQKEDKQSMNEMQAVDDVERILDQLSTGKLLSWIDGSSLEKIQAQLTEQQRATSRLVTDLPAFSAKSMATSFGLDDSEALLTRISRSGIFADTSVAAIEPAVQMHVDLNI